MVTEMMEDIIDGLDDIELENTSIDEIDSESINLMAVMLDSSGSMSRYIVDMGKSLDEFKRALVNSKDANEILLARIDFNSDIQIGGYKTINEFSIDYSANGMTCLYDAICTGVEKLKEYREFLKNQGMRVKTVFAVFSDGEDTFSNKTENEAKKAVEFLNEEEITTAFIGFGNDAKSIGKRLGFKNILNVDSTASELRRTFNCLSKSVIESSKSVVPDGDDFFSI